MSEYPDGEIMNLYAGESILPLPVGEWQLIDLNYGTEQRFVVTPEKDAKAKGGVMLTLGSDYSTYRLVRA